MNRLVMAEEIRSRVPSLVDSRKEHWKRLEKLRREFVSDYPISKIPKLSLAEYVIGKGATSRSFCYRLERETDELERILGATAFKFGIYYGKTKKDRSEKYRFVSRWGSTREKAFAEVKQAIVNLLSAAKKGDIEDIDKIPLSRMFKGKLLYLYNPEEFAPIYSMQHLQHFLSNLDLRGPFSCGTEMQQALMKYRATWPLLKRQPSVLYMQFLYDVFHYPPGKAQSETPSVSAPLLDEALKGAQFISKMPSSPAKTNQVHGNQGTTDFAGRDSQRRRIGDRGEAIVLALEKERLNRAGKRGLAARVDQVSNKDASAGFDILSFDEDGNKRRIEVKATCDATLARGFYISNNELEKSATLENYYLYIVFSAMSKRPRVLPMRKPSLRTGAFVVQPIVYRVTLP